MSNGQVDSGQRKTRKPHVCALCLVKVPVGDVADWWTWSDEGQATTYYSHLQCTEMHRDPLLDADPWDDEMMEPYDFRALCEETWPDRLFPWTEEET